MTMSRPAIECAVFALTAAAGAVICGLAVPETTANPDAQGVFILGTLAMGFTAFVLTAATVALATRRR